MAGGFVQIKGVARKYYQIEVHYIIIRGSSQI